MISRNIQFLSGITEFSIHKGLSICFKSNKKSKNIQSFFNHFE